MGALTLNWGTPVAPGMPGPNELEAAINHICADIGAGADELVVDYTATYPGPEELARTLMALRALVGDDDEDYRVNWGSQEGDGYETLTAGMPGPEELKAVLIAIHASV
jgi:hypothetical protein